MKKYLEKFKNYEYLTVLCIGDSATSQEWCHPNWYDWLRFSFSQGGDWGKAPAVRKIFNNAHDGAPIDYFLKNFDQEVKRFKPDVVIVSFGWNDYRDSKMSEKVDLLFKKIKKIGAEVVFWPPYGSLHEKYDKELAKTSRMCSRLVKKHHGIFIDMYKEFKKYDLKKIFTYQAWENTDWGMKAGEPDFIHCNEIGNQIIAQNIAKKAFGIELEEWGSQFGQMTLVNLKKYLKKKK